MVEALLCLDTGFELTQVRLLARQVSQSQAALTQASEGSMVTKEGQFSYETHS